MQADYYHVCEYEFHFLHLNTQAVLIFLTQSLMKWYKWRQVSVTLLILKQKPTHV